MVGDDVLQRHQQGRARAGGAERDEARQDLGGDLHAREHGLIGERVAHQHGQAE